METTYGERLLADAEEGARRRRHLRRMLLVFGPAALALTLATLGIISLRNQRLTDAGLMKEALDAALVVGYALVLVALPLYAAFTPALNAMMASVALVTGPVAMPLLFGNGWRVWQRLVVAAACALVIAARRSQPRPRRGRRR